MTSFQLDSEHEEFRREVREFAEKEFAPNAARWDEEEEFPEENRTELEAQIETVQAQLKTDSPDPSIINKCLDFIKPILQGATGGAIANTIQLNEWITTIDTLSKLAG